MVATKHLELSLVSLVLALLIRPLAIAGDSDSLRNDQFFESKVRPLLIDHCVKCHGDQKQEGGLRLDSQSAFDAGGESGSLVDRAEPSKSLLLNAVHHRDLQMPPTGKLPDEKIEILEEWIRSGSQWPANTKSLQATRQSDGFTAEDRAYWFFQKRKTFEPMSDTMVSDQVDRYVETGLKSQGLLFAEPGDPRVLVRRLYLDVLGVPPTPSEANAFLQNTNVDAYEKLVDQLLDDPRYAERWGRFWLDLVRYSESDGYKQDDFRPTAYRYRDYVIRAIANDKPYRDFVREQLAGDELDPDSLECRDASGYLRLWIYEYNQKDVVGQWSAILNDLTDVTGEAFLGLSYGCARCHDHKFDPILQKDYYRFQAYFSGLIPREDLPAVTREQVTEYLRDERLWKEAAQPFLDTIESIEKPIREKTIRASIDRFPPEVRPALLKSEDQRTPREKQLAHLASLQQARDVREIKWEKAIPADQLESWRVAKEYLKQLPVRKSSPLPVSLAATDVGREAAEVYVPGHAELGPIVPGAPSILDPDAMPIPELSDRNSTGRRLALANWIVQDDNPFTWRVFVNRVWQQHFGNGIVSNASDFGHLTESPSHPELLDFLADQFVSHQGKLKTLHRWILNSRTFRQSSYPKSIQHCVETDPNNKWLWRFSPRRLDADQIRDSILTVAGELSADKMADKNRVRSIYVRAMRNSPDRFLSLFDAPDASSSTAKRNSTTTPLQSLMMMNSEWVNTRAAKMAEQIARANSSPESSMREAYGRVHLKAPSESEVEAALAFLRVNEVKDAKEWQLLFVDYCHVLISSNALLYLE